MLGSRNSKRALFGGIDNLERRRKCLEMPSALEIVTIYVLVGDQNVQSTLRCQTPCHITEETSRLKILSSPTYINKVNIILESTLCLLHYNRSTGSSMEEKKLSYGNESVMSAKWMKT